MLAQSSLERSNVPAAHGSGIAAAAAGSWNCGKRANSLRLPSRTAALNSSPKSQKNRKGVAAELLAHEDERRRWREQHDDGRGGEGPGLDELRQPFAKARLPTWSWFEIRHERLEGQASAGSPSRSPPRNAEGSP